MKRNSLWMACGLMVCALAGCETAEGSPPTASESGRHTVSGRVTRTDGTPVAGATVECLFDVCNPVLFGTAWTDENGRYRIANVYTPNAEVIVHARGCQPGCMALSKDADAEVDFRLQPGYWLEGRTVNEAGEPVAGVSLRMFDRAYRFLDTISDRSGRFRLQDLAATGTNIEVEHPNYCAITRLRVVADGRRDHVIVLKAARYVSGIVLDANSGKPVKEFIINTFTTADGSCRLYKAPDGRFRHRTKEMSPTPWFHGWDTDGRSEMKIQVEAPGYLPATIEKAPVGPISEKLFVTVRLQRIKR